MNYNQIETELAKLVDQAESGNICPIEAHAQLDVLEKLAKEAKDQIKQAAVAEADLYGKDGKRVGDKVYRVANTTRYSYTYPEPVKAVLDTAKTVKADYEKLAKMGKLGLTYPDPETGEEVEVIPAKATHAVTIKGTKK